MEKEKAFLDLSKYKKLEEIGHGSFGTVYEVKQTDNGKIYAAKTSYEEFDFEDENNEQLLFLYREIKILSALNYPSIIQFIGYSPTDFEHLPKFTILTEFATNNTLRNVIKCENNGISLQNWDLTRKLINIYGIASGMSYLHKNNILHRDLKTDNILIDEYLCPKIADFGLSKIYNSISKSLRIQSQSGQKGTPIYWAPEIMSNQEYSKATDVYAFSIVVYEILTGITPYSNLDIIALMIKCVNNDRPIIPEFVPTAYRQLIEKCWSQDPKDRPTFDEIVDDLKNNSEFITNTVDLNDFLVYIDFLDNYKSTFSLDDSIHFDDFIKKKKTGFKRMSVRIKNQKIIEFVPEKISEEEKEDNNDNNNDNKKGDNNDNNENKNDDNDNDNENSNDDNGNNSNNDDDDEITLFPFDEYEKLNENCKKIVKDAEKSCIKKFIVGKNLIKGKAGFPRNAQLGIRYLQKSRSEKNKESSIYLAKMFVDGDVVPSDIEEAKALILEIDSREEDADCLFLLGRIEKKEKNYIKAIDYFKKSSKLGNAEAMFYYGKMLMSNYEGIEKDEKTANKYFELAKKNGCTKSYIPKEVQSIQNQKVNDFDHDLYISQNGYNIKNDFEYSDSENDKIHLFGGKGAKKIKIVFVGDCGIGKNALMRCVLTKIHNPSYVPSVNDNMVMPYTYKENAYNLQFWDTTGQEDLDNIRVLSYTNTDIIILVYSLTNRLSLYNIESQWYEEIIRYARNLIYIIVGVDYEKWKNNENNINYVQQSEIDEIAGKIGAAKSIKCSYITGENMYDLSYREILKTYLSNTIPQNNNKISKQFDIIKSLPDETTIKILSIGDEKSGIDLFMSNFNNNAIIQNDSFTDIYVNDHYYDYKRFIFDVTFLSIKKASNKILKLRKSNYNVILLVFSLINKDSFIKIKNFWEKTPKNYFKKATFLLIGLDREKIVDTIKNFVDQEEINDFAQIIGFNKVMKLAYTDKNQIEYCKNQIINSYLMKSGKECNIF